MKKPRHPPKKQSGMTLVEVMIGLAIISILAVLAVGSLFYPRDLVVRSMHEQTGIHAGMADIERAVYNYQNKPPQGTFGTDGYTIPTADIVTTVVGVTNNIDYPDEYSYLIISTTVTDRSGRTTELVTYRSLEVNKTLR